MALSPAMKVLWRELADRKIKEHHGSVKTTRLAAIESRTGRLSSSVAPKQSGPSGPGAGTCFQPGYPPASGDSGCLQLCCGWPSNDWSLTKYQPGLMKAASTTIAHASTILLPKGMTTIW